MEGREKEKVVVVSQVGISATILTQPATAKKPWGQMEESKE